MYLSHSSFIAGLFLGEFEQVFCPRLSVLTGSLIGVSEIGCGSAPDCLNVLLPCMKGPKRSFYEDLVMFWWLVAHGGL